MSELIIRDIKLPLGHTEDDLLSAAAGKAGIRLLNSDDFTIIRKSIDARNKKNIFFNYAVRIGKIKNVQGIAGLLRQQNIQFPHNSSADRPLIDGFNQNTLKRPVIAGFGPAGIFAALYLAMSGLRPIVLERGQPVEVRGKDVGLFWQTGKLNPESNVQFGEGGAGTFSDGKLTTGIKDPRCMAVLEELVLAGAPAETMYLAKPHLGTDILRKVVRALRLKITELGGEIRFGCRLSDLDIRQNRLKGIYYEQIEQDGQKAGIRQLACDSLILAPGHSARDTFEMLSLQGIKLQAKPFSLGLRIEHPQSLIDKAQYGENAGHPQLVPAEYKLAVHLPSGRSVYSFCMCPGGRVISASSEADGIVTNGMSYHSRNLRNANSALLVNVDPEDFGDDNPLAGISMQREIEQKAFIAAGGGYQVPAVRVGDFITRAVKHDFEFEAVAASCLPATSMTMPQKYLPGFVINGLMEAIPLFDLKIHGFAWSEAMLTGPETRSSSPVRILRDQQLQANISGLFPCGEGAGYAGGIMSAAVDGLRCAQALAMI